jgi:hypothetical protein
VKLAVTRVASPLRIADRRAIAPSLISAGGKPGAAFLRPSFGRVAPGRARQVRGVRSATASDLRDVDVQVVREVGRVDDPVGDAVERRAGDVGEARAAEPRDVLVQEVGQVRRVHSAVRRPCQSRPGDVGVARREFREREEVHATSAHRQHRRTDRHAVAVERGAPRLKIPRELQGGVRLQRDAALRDEVVDEGAGDARREEPVARELDVRLGGAGGDDVSDHPLRSTGRQVVEVDRVAGAAGRRMVAADDREPPASDCGRPAELVVRLRVRERQRSDKGAGLRVEDMDAPGVHLVGAPPRVGHREEAVADGDVPAEVRVRPRDAVRVDDVESLGARGRVEHVHGFELRRARRDRVTGHRERAAEPRAFGHADGCELVQDRHGFDIEHVDRAATEGAAGLLSGALMRRRDRGEPVCNLDLRAELAVRGSAGSVIGL